MPLTDEQLKALGLGSDAPPSVPLPASPAPSILGAPSQPQYPRSIMGDKIPQGALIPTGPNAHAQGQQEYHEFMPQITASPGTTDYFRERQEQLDYKAQHPWGDPISAHPGLGGKILHGLSVAGNIAGNIVEPGIMSMIPGTQLHSAALAAGNEKGILAGEQKDIAQEQADTAQASEKSREGLESAETGHLNAETDALKAPPPKDSFEKLQDGSIVQLTTDPHTGNSSVKLLYKGDGKTETDVIKRQVGNEQHNFLINKQTGADIRDLGKTKEEGTEGTFSLAEDGEGNPVLLNNKTGETKPAPNVHKAGTYAKGQGASNDALNYASLYEKQSPTGPGDEALMEKYFELAKPSSGFRMSQPQIEMLNKARSWMNSAEAIAEHAKSGTWFTPEQRKQIIGTMKTLGEAKQTSKGGGGGNKPPGW